MFVTGVVWTARYSAQSAEATGDGRFTVPVMAVQLNLSQKENGTRPTGGTFTGLCWT